MSQGLKLKYQRWFKFTQLYVGDQSDGLDLMF